MHVLSTFLGLNWGTPFYVMGLFGISAFFMRSKVKGKESGINWSPLESLCVTIAIYFFGQLIGFLIFVTSFALYGSIVGAHDISFFPHAFRTTIDGINTFSLTPFWQFLQTLCIEGTVLFLLVVFLRLRKANFQTIGLKKTKWLRSIVYVLLGYGVYFALYIGLLVVVQRIVAIDVNQPQQLGFKNDAHGGQLAFVFASLVLLPPFVEEVLVRGFLYSGLKKGLPVVWAALITSALFATAHLEAGSGAKLLWVAAIDTFTLSLVLIYLREKTGSLWAGIGLHMLKNGIAFISLFVFHLM